MGGLDRLSVGTGQRHRAAICRTSPQKSCKAAEASRSSECKLCRRQVEGNLGEASSRVAGDGCTFPRNVQDR
jgi:hypothetical protein